MAEFQELIKNFDKIRDYMRQFYIYGFKVRNEFDGKSGRTYDNERRRIESWMSGYTSSGYSSKGKHVYINVDSKSVSQNPLYAAWKSKSFTDNDIMLHFFLLDLLWDNKEGMTSSRLCDEISRTYGVAFDSQTVRLKLREYESLGILICKKEGKSCLYRLAPLLPGESKISSQSQSVDLWSRLIAAVKFFQEAAPFGFIGSTILDREGEENDLFQFKHHFIVHTLEDMVLADVLKAIREQRAISFENKSSRSNLVTAFSGVPLKVFVSTQTGRRYLCVYMTERRRFNNMRLDCITKVSLLDPWEGYESIRQKLEENKEKCWGVSFGGVSRMEELHMKLYIDEKKEPHILNRLHREGRGGEVLRIRENEYLYSGIFFDTNEMLSWVKTFTGRILDIQGTNQFAIAKVIRDWERMYQMYCIEPTADSPEKEAPSEENISLKEEKEAPGHGFI